MKLVSLVHTWCQEVRSFIFEVMVVAMFSATADLGVCATRTLNRIGSYCIGRVMTRVHELGHVGHLFDDPFWVWGEHLVTY